MEDAPKLPRRSSRRRNCPDRSVSPSASSKRRRISYNSSSTSSLSVAVAPSPSPHGPTSELSQQGDKEMMQISDERLLEPRNLFRFMDLPAELRVHIYRMALLREEPLYLHLPQKPVVGTDDEECCATVHSRSPRVAAVCRHRVSRPRYTRPESEEEANNYRLKDSINPALLRTCSLIYKEARQVLYSDNRFVLNLDTGIHSLESLRQRNRSLIKTVALTIPSHHDILDGFADVVRLGLRYCWGLKSLTITLPRSFPDDRHLVGTTNVYANAFHILRWLPKGCKVKMEGSVSETIRKVVADEGRLMDVLDDKEYLKRQHQMPERH